MIVSNTTTRCYTMRTMRGRCEPEYVYVGHGADAPMPDEDKHERAVADGAQNEDEEEYEGHQVRLHPQAVRHVGSGHRQRRGHGSWPWGMPKGPRRAQSPQRAWGTSSARRETT